MLCSWGSAVCGVLGLWCRGRVLLCCACVRGSWGLLWPSGCSCVGVVWLGVLPGLLLTRCVGGVGWGVCCRVLGRCALVWPVWCPAGGVLVGCCGGWVGCDLYSGREYLCSLCGAGRAPSWLCGGVVCGAACLWLGLCFVFLGVRWMPWHQGPMKDVVACDKPRGAGWRAVIRGCPNGGTRRESCRVTCI